MHKIYFTEELKRTVHISPEESRHLSKVMRMVAGDKVLLLDGKGACARAEILISHPKKTELQILEVEKIERRSSFSLTIAIAPTKNIDRFEFFLEKATEMGIDKVVPLLCARSERKVIKQERLNKILISAIKQSGQAFLPELTPLTSFKDFVKNTPGGLIAHCETDNDTPTLLNAVKNDRDIKILIGPEGDFTTDELNIALENNYTPISFGESILRTETAGIYCAAVLNARQ